MKWVFFLLPKITSWLALVLNPFITNVPLKKTIEIILSLAFQSYNKFLGFEKYEFKNLLDLTLLDNYFFSIKTIFTAYFCSFFAYGEKMVGQFYLLF